MVSQRLEKEISNKEISNNYKSYAEIPGVGRFNFIPKNELAGDIVNNDSFNKYLQRLMAVDTTETEWKETELEKINGIKK
jgi:hypothetical protein